MNMILYMRWECPYCIRVLLQAALSKEKNIRVKILESNREPFYKEHGLEPGIPVLQRRDGALMQESDDIIKYLKTFPHKLPSSPVYTPEMNKYICQDLLVYLRFSVQYYYKLHYQPSLIYNANDIAPFPGSFTDSTQQYCNILDDILLRRGEVKSISHDDFDIFPDLIVIYKLAKLLNFKCGENIDRHCLSMIEQCAHIEGVNVEEFSNIIKGEEE